MKKQVKFGKFGILAVLVLAILSGAIGQEFTTDLNEYDPQYIYDEVYQDCKYCINDNPELLGNNDSVFLYSYVKNEVKCQNYKDYMLNRALGNLYPYRAYDTDDCVTIANKVDEDLSENNPLLDDWQDITNVVEGTGAGGLIGGSAEFAYSTVKSISSNVCLGGVCFSIMFDIGELAIVMFVFMFELIWFFIGNVYIVVLLTECFILMLVIREGDFFSKIELFVSYNVKMAMLLWNFSRGLVLMLIRTVSMLRQMLQL